jgi:predicted small lipoprotein YifL
VACADALEVLPLLVLVLVPRVLGDDCGAAGVLELPPDEEAPEPPA